MQLIDQKLIMNQHQTTTHRQFSGRARAGSDRVDGQPCLHQSTSNYRRPSFFDRLRSRPRRIKDDPATLNNQRRRSNQGVTHEDFGGTGVQHISTVVMAAQRNRQQDQCRQLERGDRGDQDGQRSVIECPGERSTGDGGSALDGGENSVSGGASVGGHEIGNQRFDCGILDSNRCPPDQDANDRHHRRVRER
jgi:hypothetical protein